MTTDAYIPWNLLLSVCRIRNVNPSIVVHASKHNRKSWDGRDSTQRAKVLQDLYRAGVRKCELTQITAMSRTAVERALVK